MSRSGRIAGILVVAWVVLHPEGSLNAQDWHDLGVDEERGAPPPPEKVSLILDLNLIFTENDPVETPPDGAVKVQWTQEQPVLLGKLPPAPAPAGVDLRLMLAWLGVIAFFLALLWALSRGRLRRKSGSPKGPESKQARA